MIITKKVMMEVALLTVTLVKIRGNFQNLIFFSFVINY